jgi:hypothetical protein
VCNCTVLTVITERQSECYVECVQIVYSAQVNCTGSNYRERVSVMLSVLLYSILCVQIVYSVQVNCTDSNYRETEGVLCGVCYCTAYCVYRDCTVFK